MQAENLQNQNLEEMPPEKVLKAQEWWRRHPIDFSSQFFPGVLWQKQRDVMDAVAKYQRVAVKSGNTIGKSNVSAKIALWYLVSHYPSKVITTAPTFNQIENILWKEIAALYNRSLIPIGGQLLGTQLKISDDWFALGISTDEVNRFQGFHSPNLLVIIDEALGVDPIIWEAIEGLHPSKILAIGNPLEATGNFYNCFNSPLWKTITISCQECVQWQKTMGEIPGLVTQQWINERREEWGERSALYQGRCTGEFPIEGTNLLVQPKWLETARYNEIEEEETAVRVVHADVATKHGGNYTVIGFRIGHTQEDMEISQGLTAPMIAQNIKHKYEKNSGDIIVVDSDGFGEGIADILTHQHLGVSEFHGGYGSKAQDSLRFKNLRSQFYWIVAKKFEKGLYSLKKLSPKVYELLKAQLTCIHVKPPDATGRIQIETKDDLMARGIASPDVADSFVYGEYGWWCGRMSDMKPYTWR